MFDYTEKIAPDQEQLPTSISAKVHSVHTCGPLLAHASINLNGCFVIRGVKVVQGEHGPFVSMPSYKVNGEYRDVCFASTKEFYAQINDAVEGAYQQELAQRAQRGHIPEEPEVSVPQEAPFPQQLQ